MSRYPASSPLPIAVCGDPVVGRALVLLLRDSCYDIKFLPASSLGEPGSLEGVRLVLLTLTLVRNAEHHEFLSKAYEDDVLSKGIPILELVASSGGTQDSSAKIGSRQQVRWPCSLEELKRRIKTLLFSTPKLTPKRIERPCRNPLIWEERTGQV